MMLLISILGYGILRYSCCKGILVDLFNLFDPLDQLIQVAVLPSVCVDVTILKFNYNLPYWIA